MDIHLTNGNILMLIYGTFRVHDFFCVTCEGLTTESSLGLPNVLVSASSIRYDFSKGVFEKKIQRMGHDKKIYIVLSKIYNIIICI